MPQSFLLPQLTTFKHWKMLFSSGLKQEYEQRNREFHLSQLSMMEQTMNCSRQSFQITDFLVSKAHNGTKGTHIQLKVEHRAQTRQGVTQQCSVQQVISPTTMSFNPHTKHALKETSMQASQIPPRHSPWLTPHLQNQARDVIIPCSTLCAWQLKSLE